MTLTIGSACSGAGGLDLAIEVVFGAHPLWFCEWDAAPSKVLAHHWPGVPNYRDLTTVDWSTVPRVDVFSAGYPCQPFSAAGKRKGTDDERHLWPFIRVALQQLRPRWAVFENVAGHLTLGFDVVLGDLAQDGWYVRWFVCRASDVGAAHHRKRVFILASREPWTVPTGARPVAEHDDTGWVEPDHGLFGAIPFAGRWPNAGAIVDGIAYEVDADGRAAIEAVLPAPSASDGSGGKFNSAGHQSSLPGTVRELDVLPTPTVGNATGTNERRGGARSDEMLLPGVAVAAARGDLADGALLPTPTASNPNDGEDPATWEARRAILAERHGNNGAGMPLGIAVQTLPTPTASDADKGRDNPAQATRNSPPLSAVSAHFPTPRAAEAHQSMTAPAARQHVADGNGGLTEVLGVHLLPTPKSSDGSRGDCPSERGRRTPSLVSVDAILPTPTTSEATGAGTRGGGKDLRTTLAANFPVLPTPSAADGNGGGRFNKPGHQSTLPGTVRELPQPQGIDWGKYAPAITRWEHVLGRPAPSPTEPNKNGRPRLAALFTEWLMGWQGGHVTNPAIGLTRPEQLKICGNGVVPQQAAHALRTMLTWA